MNGKMSTKEFIPYIIKREGNQKQIIKAIEELSELAVELAKAARDLSLADREHIAEETADCYLMLDQVCEIYNISLLEVEQRKQGKVDRFCGLSEAKGGNENDKD